jgi:hypothetical protein
VEEMFSKFCPLPCLWVLLLIIYQVITTRSIPNTSLYVDLLAGVSHNPTLTFFTIMSSRFRESRTLNTPGVAVVYSIASPSSTCLALHLRGSFRELSHTMVTRLCDNDPLAFPGISPRNELMTQSAHSVFKTTSSNRQFIMESVLVLNQDPCTWGNFF